MQDAVTKFALIVCGECIEIMSEIKKYLQGFSIDKLSLMVIKKRGVKEIF